jgi:hypothetical protein
MTASNVGFNEVAELASHLSPEEQVRLVAWLGTGLNVTAASPGSATAVLRAMSEPPHLSADDLGEFEQMIASSKLPMKQDGVFDSEDAK